MSLSSILFFTTSKQKSIASITDIDQGEDRDQGRIKYLEKTIEKLQLVHTDSLTGLHNEISRLNLLLSGIL
jgi:PleD family two-component response regulator